MKKPVNKLRKRETREELWARIRKLKNFTMADIGISVFQDDSTINAYLRGLVAAGYMKREPEPQKHPGQKAGYRYTLVKDAIEPPRIKEDGTEAVMGTGRKNLWRSMQMLKTFTVTDLVACSSTDAHAVAFEEARTYVLYLERAGYLRKIGSKPISSARFMLVRWTGPRPPMIQRVKQVYDPNLKQVVWPLPEGGK